MAPELGDNLGLPSGEIVATEDVDQRLDAMTQAILKQALRSTSMYGDFHVVLSSSEVLDAAYCRLMYDPDLRAMPWGATHIWFLHEQQGDMIDETIIMHSGIPEEQVHRVSVESAMKTDADFRIDCCVLELDDISACSDAMCETSGAMLVLAENRDKLALVVDWKKQQNVYWFTKTIDLNQESP